MPDIKSADSCPCGSGAQYADCCAPYLEAGQAAPTAMALMRSRYTAFVLNNADYLLSTWHISTRPERIELDPAQQWQRLKVVSSGYDTVEFIAIFKSGGKAHKLHECSRFVFEQGKWYYVDGDMLQ